MRRLPRFLIGFLLVLGATQALAQSTAYTEVFYPSGTFRIQAYLYRPSGDGPFPLIIYNHGSRAGHEHESLPFSYIGNLMLQNRCAVLVPERRGYGRSDGSTSTDEVGQDRGPRFVARMQAETDDVLAASDFVKTLPFVDQGHIGIMGWSFGGIVTMFAASRSGAFRAVVNQAGGALVWDFSPALREAMLEAARRVRTATLLMVAQNDRTTASITAVAAALREQNRATEVIIYPPFFPTRNPGGNPPCHVLFSDQGTAIWENDVRAFFAKHLGRDISGERR